MTLKAGDTVLVIRGRNKGRVGRVMELWGFPTLVGVRLRREIWDGSEVLHVWLLQVDEVVLVAGCQGDEDV